MRTFTLEWRTHRTAHGAGLNPFEVHTVVAMGSHFCALSNAANPHGPCVRLLTDPDAHLVHSSQSIAVP